MVDYQAKHLNIFRFQLFVECAIMESYSLYPLKYNFSTYVEYAKRYLLRESNVS